LRLDDEADIPETPVAANADSSSLRAVSRPKLRNRREVVVRVSELAASVRRGLDELEGGALSPELVDGLWQGEGLGVLLWALERAALPPYDRSFEPTTLLATAVGEAQLRDRTELEHARESARLWHWRARTAFLGASGGLELPEGWLSFEQLIAVAALRGHEAGLLPAPLRGDFPAFGTSYRGLDNEQQLEMLSIAYERHRALNWLCNPSSNWASAPTDT
jgi:hypothetical protein